MVDRLRALCKERDTNFSAVEKKLGLGNASLKKTSEKIQACRLKVLADYFNVSMEYLMTGHETASGPQSNEERELLRMFRQMPIENRTELLGHARYIMSTVKKTNSSKVG